MSQTQNPQTGESVSNDGDALPDEKVELFERLSEKFDGEPLGEIFESIAHSESVNESTTS